MKSLTHIVLPIVILMGVVGVVAYMTQNTKRTVTNTTDTTPAVTPTQTTSVKLIKFIEPDAVVSPEDEFPTEVEYPSKNHKDYPFYSTQSDSIRLTADFQSCKCTTVELGTLAMADDELSELERHPSLTGYCRLVNAMNTMKFAPLPSGADDKEPGTLIPGAPPGKLKRPYILRIVWEAKNPPDPTGRTDALKVRIGARLDGTNVKSTVDRSIPFVVVPSAAAMPQTIEIGELNTAGKRSIDCYIFSGTRDHLSFKARLAGADGGDSVEPCADVSTPVELTAEERKQLPDVFEKKISAAIFRCAYRFSLTLHEHRGDNQLEIGPLSRRLVVTFDTPPGEEPIEDMRILTTALVRGSIRVLNGDERDRIPLGIYKFDRGASTIVRIGSDDAKLDLVVEHTSDPKLKATLRPPTIVEGRKEWEMLVEMEPNAFVGPLPNSTLIMLKTVGKNPRRIRIPVTGKADR